MALRKKDPSSLSIIDTNSDQPERDARIELTVCNQAETETFGHRLAAVLGSGDIVALVGDLGAGKTTLARAIIRHASGAEIDVPSPTFTVLQDYPEASPPLVHADLYRLRDPSELNELGLDEALLTGALIVEWPAIAANRLPGADLIEIRIDWVSADNPEARTINLVGGEHWRSRLGCLITP